MTKYYSEEHSVIKSLADISDIPPISSGIAGRALKINNLGTGYEWADAIIPDGRQKSIVTINENYNIWELEIGSTTYRCNLFSIPPGYTYYDNFNPVVGSYSGSTKLTAGFLNSSNYFIESYGVGTYNTNIMPGFNTPTTVMFWSKGQFKITNGRNGVAYNTFAIHNNLFSMYAKNDITSGASTKVSEIILATDISIDNQWHFVCITIDYPVVTAYIDNSIYSSTMSSNVGVDNYSLGFWDIGSWKTPANGSISNFTIYKRVLSGSEIINAKNKSIPDVALNLATQINNSEFIATSTNNSIFIVPNSTAPYTITCTNASIEVLPREFSLESLTEVPEPEAGKVLTRNQSNTSYQWEDFSFVSLIDTPNSYSQGKYLVSTASGIALSDPPAGGVSSLISLTDTPSSYDNGKYLMSTSNGAVWSDIGNADVTVVSGGATTFISLTDTPSSYDGYAGCFLKVTNDGVAFVDISASIPTKKTPITVTCASGIGGLKIITAAISTAYAKGDGSDIRILPCDGSWNPTGVATPVITRYTSDTDGIFSYNISWVDTIGGGESKTYIATYGDPTANYMLLNQTQLCQLVGTVNPFFSSNGSIIYYDKTMAYIPPSSDWGTAGTQIFGENDDVIQTFTPVVSPYIWDNAICTTTIKLSSNGTFSFGNPPLDSTGSGTYTPNSMGWGNMDLYQNWVRQVVLPDGFYIQWYGRLYSNAAATMKVTLRYVNGGRWILTWFDSTNMTGAQVMKAYIGVNPYPINLAYPPTIGDASTYGVIVIESGLSPSTVCGSEMPI